MANHSRWCDLNPKRSQYANDMSKVRAAITPQSRIKQKLGIKIAHTIGKYSHIEYGKFWLGKTHTEETKKILKEKALASSHRRLRRGMIEYNGVMLDSSWELALAKRLDELHIVWIRPDPLKWTDNEGIIHNYFPDFYLPKYNLFLDPKNPQAIKVQKEKLNILCTQYTNIVIIDTLEKCKDFTI